jgi:hypothetical protein
MERYRNNTKYRAVTIPQTMATISIEDKDMDVSPL